MGVILGVIVARNFYVLYVFQQLYVLYMLFSSHMLQGAVRGYWMRENISKCVGQKLQQMFGDVVQLVP